MKIALRKIVDQDVLDGVAVLNSSTKVAAFVSYRLNASLAALDERQQVFLKVRSQLAEKYAERDAKGNVKKTTTFGPNGPLVEFNFTPENALLLERELEELLDEEIEIPDPIVKLSQVVPNVFDEQAKGDFLVLPPRIMRKLIGTALIDG